MRINLNTIDRATKRNVVRQAKSVIRRAAAFSYNREEDTFSTNNLASVYQRFMGAVARATGGRIVETRQLLSYLNNPCTGATDLMKIESIIINGLENASKCNGFRNGRDLINARQRLNTLIKA